MNDFIIFAKKLMLVLVNLLINIYLINYLRVLIQHPQLFPQRKKVSE